MQSKTPITPAGLPLPKRKPDFERAPMTPEHLATLRGPKAQYVRRQCGIGDFEYVLDVGLFKQHSSGEFLISDEVDSLCEAIEVKGEAVCASEFLKRLARTLNKSKK